MKTRHSVFLPVVLAMLATACRDDPPEPEVSGPPAPGLLDSVNMLFEDVFLWNEEMDRAMNPPTMPDGGDREVALRSFIDRKALSALDPQTSLPYEFDPANIGSAKYSTFVARPGSTEPPGDFGFALSPSPDGYRVAYVRRGSAAARAGMVRSDRLVHLNGRDVDMVNEGSTSFIRQALLQDRLEGIMESRSGRGYALVLDRKKRGSEVLKDTVLSAGSVRVAYLALRAFPSLPQIRAELDGIFADFAQQGAEHLVVDLRYNSGGFVSTSRYMANLIAPARLQGAKMYHLGYNRAMREARHSHLSVFPVLDIFGLPELREDGSPLTFADFDYSEEANTYRFEKKGTFDNVRGVYFIVSERTASAAELLVNNLRPHVPVTLVGRRTYGKPVGYFAVGLGGHDVYLSAFLAFNARGEGRYFGGMEVDFPAGDDLFTDFGTPDGPAMRSVLSHLSSDGRAMPHRLAVPAGGKHSIPPLLGDNSPQPIGMLND